MSNHISRFIERLSLPTGLKAIVTESIPNPTPPTLQQLKNYKKPLLELYFVNRHTRNILWTAGRSEFGNKGRGVYLANHSRYSLMWTGFDTPVMVCHVPAVSTKLKRFRSEIFSPKPYDSEYLVPKDEDVYVAYNIRYKVEGLSKEHFESLCFPGSGDTAYVPHGYTGCPDCDIIDKPYGGLSFGKIYTTKGKRCDCPLTPIADPLDLVTVKIGQAIEPKNI